MYDELTIVFTGHNIKWFAVSAIESFLRFYPFLRKNILYFDDESTDESREELEKRGIKVTTWTKDAKANYIKNIESGVISNEKETQKLCTRVATLTNDLISQVTTKYVLICDGDILYKKGGFLEEHFKSIQDGIKIVTYSEVNSIPNSIMKELSEFEMYDYYTRYLMNPGEFHSNSDIETKNMSYAPRVRLLHTFIDLEYLKSLHIEVENTSEEHLRIMTGFLVDGGTYLYHQIKDKNIPTEWIGVDEINDLLHHWGWISSANRSEFNSPISRRDLSEEMDTNNSFKEIKEILKEIGIHPLRLSTSFNKNKTKTTQN